MEKTGEKYWENIWLEATQGSRPINFLKPRGLWHSCYFGQFHQLWDQYLPRHRVRFLEVGCANSDWLPYFAKVRGYEIAGLEYSEIGCDLARASLSRHAVEGEVYHQDLFNPQRNQRGRFEVVFSNGLVEHFHPPEEVLRALSVYLSSGGLIVTIIPNLSGWLGRMQNLISKEIMDIHIPLTCEELEEIHQSSGFRKRYCDYLIFLNPYCLGSTFQGWRKLCFGIFKKGFGILTGGLGLRLSIKPGAKSASYIVYIGEKV